MPRREVTGNRRNAAPSGDLVDFRWRRAVRGYEVIDVPNERILPTNRDALELPLGQRYEAPSDFEAGSWSERMVIEQDIVAGHPLEVRRYPMRLGGPVPLFAVLANLGAASRERPELEMDGQAAFESRVVAFAGRHGPLGQPVKIAMPDERVAFAEPVSLWEREVQAIGDVLKRWQPDIDGGVPSWPGDAERREVQQVINDRIGATGGSWARLLWDRGSERLVLRLVPESLLGAIWLQLARWVDVGARFVRCQNCARWISLHPDKEIGRRSQTRSCSERCRKALHDKGRRQSQPSGIGQ